jgi:hypothetical protein
LLELASREGRSESPEDQQDSTQGAQAGGFRAPFRGAALLLAQGGMQIASSKPVSRRRANQQAIHPGSFRPS